MSLRGRRILPDDKPVVVSVSRISAPAILLLFLIFSAVCFIGGVVAGTSGYYREFATWVTQSFGESRMIRKVLLWPDFAVGDTMSERLRLLEARLVETSAAAEARNRQLADRYSRQAEGLLDFRGAIGDARNSCTSAQTQGNAAANYSWQTRQQVEILQALLAAAVERCAAGHPTAETSRVPGSTQ